MTEFVRFRQVQQHELEDLLAIYRHLNLDDDQTAPAELLQTRWNEILSDPKIRLLVAAIGSRLVSTCTLVIIPNLTRRARPYALIENVVTHADYRRQGIGSRLLRYALNNAWEHDCYKVMLLSGSMRVETHRFYQRCGFRRDIKTGYVARPE